MVVVVGELAVSAGWCVLVIRADEQTFATAEKTIADFWRDIGWDFVRGFDCQVADTPGGVKEAIGAKRPRWAGFDAFVAFGAGFFDVFIADKREICNQLAEEDLGADAGIDEHVIFANEAEAGL